MASRVAALMGGSTVGTADRGEGWLISIPVVPGVGMTELEADQDDAGGEPFGPPMRQISSAPIKITAKPMETMTRLWRINRVPRWLVLQTYRRLYHPLE